MRLPLAITIAAVLFAGRAHAEAPAEEAMARRVLIVLRVLAYDRALAVRSPGEHVNVLLVAPPTQQGRATLALWSRAFALLPNVKAGGRRIRVRTYEVTGDAALDAVVAEQRPALLVATTAGLDVAAVRQVTRKRRVLSFSVAERDVRSGLAFGVVDGEERNEIVINLDAARAEGARFSAGLLQLARLVDEASR